VKLSVEESFQAMVSFLEKYNDRVPSDDIATLLSSMIIIDDQQKTSDPALWQDFVEIINNIVRRK
jgi:hypothetical protein